MTMLHGKWNILLDRMTVHMKVQILFQHYFQCVFTVNIFFSIFIILMYRKISHINHCARISP